MDKRKLREIYIKYKNVLLDDVVPFWLENSIDENYGGFFGCLDRDWSLYNTDKSVWIQGRGVWIFSKLYNKLEKKEEWLEAARQGYKFLKKYCFDKDGRMFFLVTEDGKPLSKSGNWYSEIFAVIGCAEYAKATGDEDALQIAENTYKLIINFYKNPELLPVSMYPKTRSIKRHADSMALIAVSQMLREVDNNPLYKEVIDMCLGSIFDDFVKRDKKALLETVGLNGEYLDIPEGRCVNPGHAIESSGFLLEEGQYRSDQIIIKKALEILDWSLNLGWDKKYGGILYFVDIEGKPPEQLEWDMKLWWPQTEALYALLLACIITGDSKYEEWFDKVDNWVFSHFPDKKYGEWCGYLHRDGSISIAAKGNNWKGPYHLPRFLLYSIKLLEKMI